MNGELGGHGGAAGIGEARPAVFLDRDGTLIAERDYLADPAGVELIPGALSALRSLREAGLALVIVTNQSGITRGLYSEEDYSRVTERLESLFAEAGIRMDGIYHCPHHPDFDGGCDCRKPGPGMYAKAARELGLDLRRSFYVGDKLSDVLPARRFGGEGLLVRTGYGLEWEPQAPAWVDVVDDVAGAADRILADLGRQ
jgi:D-glycero-D-manno-heptose 1,7-bisphosphate phosphatase